MGKKESDEATLQVSNEGAPGPADIFPIFLKALESRARQELLDIFSLSFSTGNSPQVWKIAITLLFKKAGKPSGCIPSYRPASLASCVTEMLQRILHNGLYSMSETRDGLCTEQVDFPKKR